MVINDKVTPDFTEFQLGHKLLYFGVDFAEFEKRLLIGDMVSPPQYGAARVQLALYVRSTLLKFTARQCDPSCLSNNLVSHLLATPKEVG